MTPLDRLRAKMEFNNEEANAAFDDVSMHMPQGEFPFKVGARWQHKQSAWQSELLLRALGILEEIAMNKYGLQGLLEEDAPEEKISEYWSELALRYERKARTLLAELGEGK